MHVLVDGEVRERLVHDGDNRGLFLGELGLGIGALLGLAGSLVVLAGELLLELFGLGHVVVLGHGRLDGLRGGDERGDEALAVVALERAPGVHGDVEGVVVVDERDVGANANEAQGTDQQVGEEETAVALGGLGAESAGERAQQHGDSQEGHAVQAERAEDVGEAAAHRGSSAQGGEVGGLDGHGLERDDEELGHADAPAQEGDERRGATATLEQVEQADHDGGDECPLKQDAQRVAPGEVMVGGGFESEHGEQAGEQEQHHADRGGAVQRDAELVDAAAQLAAQATDAGEVLVAGDATCARIVLVACTAVGSEGAGGEFVTETHVGFDARPGDVTRERGPSAGGEHGVQDDGGEDVVGRHAKKAQRDGNGLHDAERDAPAHAGAITRFLATGELPTAQVGGGDKPRDGYDGSEHTTTSSSLNGC